MTEWVDGDEADKQDEVDKYGLKGTNESNGNVHLFMRRGVYQKDHRLKCSAPTGTMDLVATIWNEPAKRQSVTALDQLPVLGFSAHCKCVNHCTRRESENNGYYIEDKDGLLATLRGGEVEQCNQERREKRQESVPDHDGV